MTIPRVTKFSTQEFSVGYCASAAQPGEYGVNRTHVLKGSNSYRNVSLSLSTPHRVRRHRSHTSAIRPSFHTHRSQQSGEAEMRPKKHGTYLTFTAKEKARVATYGGINGARAAVKRACVPWVNNNRRGHIYRRGHAARSDRSCNFGCISGTKV